MDKIEHLRWYPNIPYCQKCSEREPDTRWDKELPNNGRKHCVSCGDCLNDKPFYPLGQSLLPLCMKEECENRHYLYQASYPKHKLRRISIKIIW